MNDFSVLCDIPTPLLYWYQGAKRDLPWRREPTPYHVWISEIMLQQTRVEAVKGYYERFLAAFPTVSDLAAADDDVLNKVWQGLGYYSRARNLKKAAAAVMEQYGGELPCDHKALLGLPGIGAYTAGAIGSIAFGLPTPAVDGNVLRVVTRLCGYDADIAKQTTKDTVSSALAEIYPRTPAESSAFTQALMELGATVCVPNGMPHCAECPLAHLCAAHAAGRETELPKKAPKKPRTVVCKTVFLLRCGEYYALRRRPDEGLLAGLWEFPSEDTVMTRVDMEAWLSSHGFAAKKIMTLSPAKHIFTHIEWHMTGYLCETENRGKTPDFVRATNFVWATKEEIAETYSVPSAFSAYLKIVLS